MRSQNELFVLRVDLGRSSHQSRCLRPCQENALAADDEHFICIELRCYGSDCPFQVVQAANCSGVGHQFPVLGRLVDMPAIASGRSRPRRIEPRAAMRLGARMILRRKRGSVKSIPSATTNGDESRNRAICWSRQVNKLRSRETGRPSRDCHSSMKVRSGKWRAALASEALARLTNKGSRESIRAMRRCMINFVVSLTIS
jgi:hypothetical protein